MVRKECWQGGVLNCEGPVRMRALERGDAEEVARGGDPCGLIQQGEVFGLSQE